mgnify:CR=1 FL=1
MIVEMSLEDLKSLNRLAVLGRLMAGLIHNVNGPLQTIGIDLELMALQSMQDGPSNIELAKKIGPRLQRMEGEFDAINQLIRTTSVRASTNEEYNHYRTLNDFIEDEFSFLKANLYFKHVVRKDYDFSSELPSFSAFSGDIPLGLRWFFHALVDELERRKIPEIRVRTLAGDPKIHLLCSAKGGDLSEPFLKGLSLELSASQTIRIEKSDLAVTVAVVLLQQAGVLFSTDTGAGKTLIHLQIPVPGATEGA